MNWCLLRQNIIYIEVNWVCQQVVCPERGGHQRLMGVFNLRVMRSWTDTGFILAWMSNFSVSNLQCHLTWKPWMWASVWFQRYCCCIDRVWTATQLQLRCIGFHHEHRANPVTCAQLWCKLIYTDVKVVLHSKGLARLADLGCSSKNTICIRLWNACESFQNLIGNGLEFMQFVLFTQSWKLTFVTY